MSILLINADSLHIPLADNSVQTCVTSPPYWGLRSYDTGDNKAYELGAEPTPDEYVANMVTVFREVRRVLRDDGTLWLNLGDSYVGGGKKGDTEGDKQKTNQGATWGNNDDLALLKQKVDGLKQKDLVGIPWRVAFALQADGWYLRSDIIWHKPNPMPESVTDRPTKSHEYVFLLTKSARYYFDQDAVREEHARDWWNETVGDKYMTAQDGRNDGGKREGNGNPAGRNIRTVWTIATQPTPFAHFATYPEKLVEPCIKAGTSERGCCPKCGKAWVRVTEKESVNPWAERVAAGAKSGSKERGYNENHGAGMSHDLGSRSTTTGWQPACECFGHFETIKVQDTWASKTTGTHETRKVYVPNPDQPDPTPCIVLDPFAGSGTTGIVARRLGRHFVGLDLSRTYLHTIARRRLELDRLDAWTNGIQAGDDGWRDLPMFQGTQP